MKKGIFNFIKARKKVLLSFLITANLALVATGSALPNIATESASQSTPSAVESQTSPTATVSGEVTGPPDVEIDRLDNSLYIDREEAKKINIDSTGKYVADEIVVKYKTGKSKLEKETVVRDKGVKIARDMLDANKKVLKVDPTKRDETLERLKRDPNIESANLDGIIMGSAFGGGGGFSSGGGAIDCATTTPNDTYYPYQWGLTKIKAPQAWNLNKGSSSIQVAVIDSGVNYNHPDLAYKVQSGWDFVGNDSNPMDEHGHGTGVASVIAAKTNNCSEIAGVNWNTTVVSVRVLDANNIGTNTRLEDALYYVNYSHPTVKVVNLSLSGFEYEGMVFARMAALTTRATVIAATNYNPGYEPWCDIGLPAGYDKVIAVNATDSNDDERIGCGITSAYPNKILVSAPGDNIHTLGRLAGTLQPDGTSFAAPHVSGLAAILWGCMPSNLSESEKLNKVKDSIVNGLDITDPNGNWGRLSSGRINMHKALDYYCY